MKVAMTGGRVRTIVCAAALALAAVPGSAAAASGPQPGSPAYFQRDNQNMLDAYGRQSGPGGQLSPGYLAEVFPAGVPGGLAQVAEQAQNPTRPIVDPGQWFPGWNEGNAFRQTWPGTRGLRLRV